jgi:hypothetical protein
MLIEEQARIREPIHTIMHELKTLEQGPLVGGLFLARVARAGGYG